MACKNNKTCIECNRSRYDMKTENLSVDNKPTLLFCPFEKFKKLFTDKACENFEARERIKIGDEVLEDIIERIDEELPNSYGRQEMYHFDLSYEYEDKFEIAISGWAYYTTREYVDSVPYGSYNVKYETFETNMYNVSIESFNLYSLNDVPIIWSDDKLSIESRICKIIERG